MDDGGQTSNTTVFGTSFGKSATKVSKQEQAFLLGNSVDFVVQRSE